MNKFIYIGEYGDKCIFYHQMRDAFYLADYFFFDEFANEENPEISEEQEEKLASTLVTDEELLEELRDYYVELQKRNEAHEKRLNEIRNRIKKRGNNYKKINEIKKACINSFSVSCAIGLLCLSTKKLGDKVVDKFASALDEYHYEHQNDDEHLSNFLICIDENRTISDEIRDLLKADFSKLVESDIYISDYFKMEGICNRLRETDFSNYNEDNYTSVLAYIVFNSDDILSKCAAIQLDESANNREVSDLSLLFGSLSAGMKKDVLNDLFIYGNDKYIKDLTEYYDASKSDIQELIKLLEIYEISKTTQEKNDIATKFNKKLSSILTNYYRDEIRVSEIHKYILASQAYNGEFKIQNNLFSDYLVISYDDSTYGKYNLYYDVNSGKDMSYQVYYEKLVDLIREKGNGLDYNDSDCRFLMYMVNLTYKDKMYYDFVELLDCITPEDLATKMLENIFSKKEVFVNLDPQILYAYFTSGNLPVYKMARKVSSPNNDALSMALFQEFQNCLKIDLKEGNISSEEYQEYMENFLKWIKPDKEGYEILLNALNTDTSLFKELKLYPFRYSFANDDVKAYIYIPNGSFVSSD